ncbi:MAG: hypothetical protein QOD88_4760 [Mycobacterium sp.]|jgi:hypothetical protein|nr:hypothetical protein [Mycobacterium sp.]
MAGKERYGLGFNLLLIQSLPDVAPRSGAGSRQPP